MTSGAEWVHELYRSTSESDLAEGVFRIVPVTSAEYTRARDWLGTFSGALRTLDALHMAAAANNDAVLLTADSALAEAAELFGVSCQLVE